MVACFDEWFFGLGGWCVAYPPSAVANGNAMRPARRCSGVALVAGDGLGAGAPAGRPRVRGRAWLRNGATNRPYTTLAFATIPKSETAKTSGPNGVISGGAKK